jgi:hypothetical protein
MLPVSWNQNNDWLATNGYMTATALDTRVQTVGGLNKPWMVTEDKTLTAIAVAASSQTNLIFATGETAATSMDIITGYGGYVTVADAAALELGTSGEIEIDGYVDTSIADILVDKTSAFNISSDGAGNIQASINAWRIGNTDNTPAGWANPTNAYDFNTGTAATVTPNGWSSWIEISYTNPVVLATRARYWMTRVNGNLNNMEVEVYYAAAWHNIFSGDPTPGAYVNLNIAGTPTVSAVRARFNDQFLAVQGSLFELQVEGGDPASVAATSGEMVITASITAVGGGTLTLDVDGTSDSVVVGSGVPDNANDWVIGSAATPYMDYYKHTVAGTLIAHYQPIAIIVGTALPDREGAAQNGVITWGANPAGVAVTVGGLVSAAQSVSLGTADSSTGDILPVSGGSDWNTEPAVTGALLTNPLRPIVTAVSDNTTLTERQVWVLFGLITVVFITVLVGASVRGHHLITGIASGLAMVWMIVWTVFPIWAVIVVILAVVGGLISERSPSL